MKFFIIIGVRPQFIKTAVVSGKMCERKDVQEIIMHTGRHCDAILTHLGCIQV